VEVPTTPIRLARVATVCLTGLGLVSGWAPSRPAVLPGVQDQSSDLAACEARVRATRSFGDWLCFTEIATRSGRFDDAAAVMRGLLDEEPQDGIGWFTLALVRERQGSPDAISHYRTALAIFERIGDEPRVLWTRLAIANEAILQGLLDEAETELDTVETAMPTDPPADPYGRLLIAQGRLAYYRGDYGTAVRRLQAAGDFSQGSFDLESQRLSSLGAVHWATGRAPLAREYYLREAQLASDAGQPDREASALVNLAFLAPILGQSADEQRRLAAQALAAAEAGGNRSAAGRAHGFLARLSTGAEAVRHAEASLALLGDVPLDRPLGLRYLAEATLTTDPVRAFALVDQAIAEARRLGDAYEVARSAVARARMRWGSGPREAAIADSLAAFDAIEATRGRQPEADMRAMGFANWGVPYFELVTNLLTDAPASPRDADLELAFATVERSRARVLLETIGDSWSGLVPSPERQTEHDRTLRAIVDLQRRLTFESWADGERAEAIDRLARLEREERELRSLEARRAGDASGPTPAFASSREVRSELGEDEAFVTIFDQWALAHTTSATRVYELPGARATANTIGLFNQLVVRRDGSETAAGVRLYQALLADVLADLPAGISRLIISPDAWLQVLPFDLLRESTSAEPVGARFVTSIVPSATTWLRWRRTPSPPADMATYVAADPETGTSRTSGSTGRRLWVLGSGEPLVRLPHARREARTIASVVPEATVAVGVDATEAALKTTDLGRYGLLHFATHAVIDSERPERSAVILAPGADGEDGLMQPRDIARLDLTGRVVLLSACQSASGLVVGGEGVLGLTHAFFQAGARAVVASAWPLEDREAADLFESFYEALAQGATLADALASARRERLAAGAPAAAWAGVTIYGDGDIAPFSGSSADGRGGPAAVTTVSVGAVILLLCASAVVVFRHWRRRGFR